MIHRTLVRIPVFAIVLSASILFSLTSHSATIENVRLWPAPDHTRLVFDLSGPVNHDFFTLSGPRLVIDIDNTQMNADLSSIDLEKTPIANIRSGSPRPNTLRIVLDMKEEVDTKLFALKKMRDIHDRLVLDLVYRNRQTGTDIVLQDPTTEGRRDIIIAVDAGHGGEDPGALGPGGLYEKNVVLDISLKLAKVINKTPGYEAVLTRSDDYGVQFKQRRELARKQRADLFLSIHADAFKQKSVNGASVFALNVNGKLATSETARYLAERANEADLIGGVGSVSIKDMDETVASTLMDLSQTATLSSSLRAGQYILDAMAGVARLHKKQVEQADFVVLRSPDLPSLLIETGFISNPRESKKLATASYREKMAESIFSGIKHYFYDFAPPGTYVAWKKQNGVPPSEHIIARGDTLSGIATRYKVSIADIIAANGLSTTTIRIGQKLKIPST